MTFLRWFAALILAEALSLSFWYAISHLVMMPQEPWSGILAAFNGAVIAASTMISLTPFERARREPTR